MRYVHQKSKRDSLIEDVMQSHRSRNYLRAIEIYEQALHEPEEVCRFYGEGMVYYGLGMSYTSAGMYQKSYD